MSDAPLLASVDARGIATLTLNRPDVHNAFDDRLIAALTEQFLALDADRSVRAVLLRGAGKSFSAGGDLNWMQRVAGYGEAENLADAGTLARMLQAVDGLSKPVVAAVHGNCFAGGIGLVACADIAIATTEARFSLSEVRLGLVPATIGPYVIRAIGPRAARRYFLTAERFSAARAQELGLVHEVVAPAGFEVVIAGILEALTAGGPKALHASKKLIAEVAGRPIDAEVSDYTVRTIAQARASAEAREGLTAFFEKRKPDWQAHV